MNVDTAGKRAEGLLKRQPEQKQRSLICIPEISFALKSIKTFYLIARSVCVCVWRLVPPSANVHEIHERSEIRA